VLQCKLNLSWIKLKANASSSSNN